MENYAENVRAYECIAKVLKEKEESIYLKKAW